MRQRLVFLFRNVKMHGKKSKHPNPELNKNQNVNPPKSSAKHHEEPKPCSETSPDFIKRLNHKAPFQELPTPVKSASDKKEYKVIRLANGLTACLISDPTACNNDEEESSESECESGSDASESGEENVSAEECDDDDSVLEAKQPEQKMAAAALCVGVGSFSDPKDIPGMAHFLEHMVFMGSEKFPQENDFDSFITSRGGFDNASTDVETTVFYFECLKKHLYQGLDKFAQFFISPLMLRGSITREREAIDSEFQQALPIDMNRKEQLLMSLSKPESPVNVFSWGNLKTLRDDVGDSALYEALHDFRKRHYSAHRMTLAIQAGLPIDLLQAYVLDCFSNIPSNNLPPNDFSIFKNVYDTPEWNRIYFVEPTDDTTLVEITFALPSLLDKYKNKSHIYVSGILGDEGKGSLMSYLRKKVWVLSIITGNSEYGSEHNSMYSFFAIMMHLTAEGLQNLFTIIETVFAFINMLKTVGPQERIYNEMKQIEDISFRFAAERSVDENVEEIATQMQIYPPEDYLTGPDLYYEYDPEGIKMVMDHLVPRKANIMVMTKHDLVFKDLDRADPIQYDKAEKWFGTRYTDREIPEEHLLKWETARPLDEFALPSPNQFLTTDFGIVPSPGDSHPEFPVKIFKDVAMEVWHRKDEKFQMPVAVWYINLVSPLAVETTKNKTMLDLYVGLLSIHLAEEAWPATQAELSYKISASENGMAIKVNGLNEKLPILIDLLVKHLKSFTCNLTEATFAAVKDHKTKAFHNMLLKPGVLAKDIRLDAILKKYQSVVKKYRIISKITFEDLKTFADQLLKRLYVRVLVQGNVSKEQALHVAGGVRRDLGYEPIAKADYPLHHTVRIPVTKTICRLKSLNKGDSNSAIVNYYQGDEFNMKDSMVLEMAVLLIQEPLFDTLRTKEQLGYSVHCSVRETYGVLGLSVTVNAQADKHSAAHVDERIEAFMKRSLELLKDVPESEFEDAKCDLIKKKQCADNSLAEEASRNWSEIIADTYMYDRLKQEVACIEKLKRSDVLDWWEKYIFSGSKGFTYSMMSTQVVGYGTKEPSNQDCDEKMETDSFELDFVKALGPNCQTIMDLEEFKKKCTFFPDPKLKCPFYEN